MFQKYFNIPVGTIATINYQNYATTPMKDDDAIDKFGLPSTAKHRQAIRAALEAELLLEENEEGNQSLIKCLVVQLFSIGNVEDILLIWRAKSMNFDLMCGLDIQFLCGAGIETTKTYLSQSDNPASIEALECLDKCIASGDFINWTRAKWISYYRYYFHLDPQPPQDL